MLSQLPIDILYRIFDVLPGHQDYRSLRITCKVLSLSHSYPVGFLIRRSSLEDSLAIAIKEYPWLVTSDVVIELIHRGASTSWRNTLNGRSILHYAAMRQVVPLVMMLSDRVFDKDINGSTPLHIAVRLGDIVTVKTLLNMGAHPYECDKSNKTPVSMAIYNRRVDLLRMLLNTWRGRRGISMIQLLPLAVSKHRRNVLRYLLREVDMDPDTLQNALSETLLTAARQKCDNTVRWLVKESNVNIFSKDYLGDTLIHVYAALGNVAMLRFLAGHQPFNIEIQNRDKNTPLHLAARNGEVEMVKYLIFECSANTNAENGYYFTPLHCAAYSGHLAIVRLLLDVDYTHINAGDYRGKTPLHWAVICGHEHVAEAIIFSGRCMSRVDGNGCNPLHCAAAGTSIKLVRLLGALRPDLINQRNKFGRTPLHLAAINGQKDIAEYLVVNLGARILRDHKKKTPLQLAIIYRHTEVADMLRHIA